MIKSVFLIILLNISILCLAQEIPYHVSNKALYDFLDELAANKVVEINNVVRPYSRKLIAEILVEAQKKADQLSKRQQKEIVFYLNDFAKDLPNQLEGSDHYISTINQILKGNKTLTKRVDLFYYKDSLFTLTINPLIGGTFYSNDSGRLLHRYVGAEAYANIGKHWSFYANLRDNNENISLIRPNYFTQHEGASFKGVDSQTDRVGIDWSESRGGLVYSWDWGSFGFVKDHVVWGTNNHGANILSGHTPSFALLKLNLKPVKWFEFNYVHGWLSSRIVDSVYIYKYASASRAVFINKYLTANLYTFSPFKHLNISVGNSVIYAEKDYPHYLIPVLFYKSVDHSTTMNNNFGTNAQMFFDISSRQIKHLHLYTSVYIDEIGISRMWVDTAQSNFVSLKLGIAVNDLGIKNVTFITEYTRTNPLTYQHFLPVTTFASSDFNLGHYLRDNSDEVYFELRYKPIRGLQISGSYTKARHGDDFIYGNKVSYGKYVSGPWGLPFMENITWQSNVLSIGASWQMLNDVYLTATLQKSSTSGNVKKYTPEFYHGNQTTFITGLNIGF